METALRQGRARPGRLSGRVGDTQVSHHLRIGAEQTRLDASHRWERVLNTDLELSRNRDMVTQVEPKVDKGHGLVQRFRLCKCS